MPSTVQTSVATNQGSPCSSLKTRSRLPYRSTGTRDLEVEVFIGLTVV